MFVTLTRKTGPLSIRTECILSFYATESTTGLPNRADPVKGTYVNTAGEGYFVQETPEQIMALIEGKAEAPAPAIVDGVYPDFPDPYEESVQYWQKRSQYWKVRSYHFERLCAKP